MYAAAAKESVITSTKTVEGYGHAVPRLLRQHGSKHKKKGKLFVVGKIKQAIFITNKLFYYGF